jgi:hypothetical protein
MASNTSYPDAYRVTLVFSCFNRALPVTYERSAVIMPELGCEDSTLLCSYLSRSNLLWLIFDYQRFSLISA